MAGDAAFGNGIELTAASGIDDGEALSALLGNEKAGLLCIRQGAAHGHSGD